MGLIKIRKGNVKYTIDENQLNRFKYMGYVVDGEVLPKAAKVQIVEEIEEEIIESELEDKPKNLYHMTKEEVIELAISKGINVTGDEKINEIRAKIKNG